MISYIINVAIMISVCLFFYRLLLRRETFYRINRWILLACILLSFTLPLVPVPRQLTWRTLTQPNEIFTPASSTPVMQYYLPEKLESAEGSNQETKAAGSVVQSSYRPSFIKQINWLNVAFYLYVTGVVIFGLNLLFQFSILLYLAYRRKAIRDGEFRIVETTGDRSPCSFGNTIFINPSRYDKETYQQILLHEKIHCSQKHSIDIMLAELMLVVQWFNPFAWLYRKEVENNIEFLTDDSVIRTDGIEKVSYQLSLLKVSASHLPLSLTINYNQSLLKKRIVMMNAKKSSARTAWKYFFLLPVLAILVLALNEPGAVAQINVQKQTASKKQEITQQQKETAVHINQEKQVQAQASTGVQVKNSVSTRTDQEIKNSAGQQLQQQQKETIKSKGQGIDTEGTWFARIKKEEVCIDFKSDKDGHDWSSNSCFKKSEFPALPATEFKLTRDAGTIFFKGKFDGDIGYGQYTFKGDESFSSELKKLGVKDLDRDENELFVFFMVNVSKSYVTMLGKNGFEGISKNNLIAMAAMKIDETYIANMKASGFKDLEAHELISSKAMKMDGAYVKEIRDAGYPDISMNELIAFKAQGIDKSYIQELKSIYSGSGELPSAQQVLSYKSLKIDQAFLKTFADLGYKHLSHNDVFALKSLGITSDFIKGFEAIGYRNIPVNTLFGLKSTGVKPDFIKGFQKLGFTDISLNDVTAVKSMGITPEYVQSMRAKGFDSKDLNKYIALKSSWK